MDPFAFRRMVREERSDLLAFLGTLSEAQWDAPTLCEGWAVRDVVAHVVSFDEANPAIVSVELARARFSIDRLNQSLVDRGRSRSPEELSRALGEHLTPRRTGALIGPGALSDALIHHQDIRRPLKAPRAIPAERLKTCLDVLRRFPNGAGGLRRARGLRFVATDIGWGAGAGPEVRGPGEALIMALAGRAVALDDVTGEGKEILARRMPG